ncbi:hypothetical protein I3760_09G168600 [Carya illinoinensis]|uniref:Uncharacterized protein n=1 Tax=Carya illinoinensis TaxID=32201 RepID=A0A8T1PE42_CARIL|nr:hypothetical protein I3760_09G168600 [Carya illinoinensis]KAG6642866.1 hypothetical protein CIPAW_09G170200 [Carya illinoinensis]
MIEAKLPMNVEATPPSLPLENLFRNKTPPIQHLNPSEIQERRKKGLCFNCDENFVPNHRCKKLFLIEGIFLNEEELESDRDEEERVTSLYAIMGTTSPQTMRIIGVMKGHGIIVLDSESSHNFLNTSFIEAMGLPFWHMCGMKVMVANGEKLDCNGRCDGVQIFFCAPWDQYGGMLSNWR